MEEQQLEPLGAKEYSEIGKALWELVKQYPAQDGVDPDVVAQYNALDSDKSLAVFTLPGGRKKKKYVSGTFVGEISFRISYKSNPTNSQQHINAQAFVGRVMEWLEDAKALPILTDGRTITGITALTVPPFQFAIEGDKSTIYAADAVMEYTKQAG